MRRILTILMLVAVSAAAAQERFDHIFRRNPWNGGLNAAGIRQDSLSRSYAEIYFTKENGGLAGHSASDDSWNAGAKTESVRHLKKVSFSGGFGYDYFDGRNMCGSMFTEPGYYPVDILEFTPGRKVREDYTFTGGVSAVLGNRWTGGLRVEFEARNYAKRKDLRHKNTRLDFEFSPGVMYHAGRFAVGAVYIVGTRYTHSQRSNTIHPVPLRQVAHIMQKRMIVFHLSGMEQTAHILIPAVDATGTRLQAECIQITLR